MRIRSWDELYTITNSIFSSYMHKQFQLNTFKRTTDIYIEYWEKNQCYQNYCLLHALYVQWVMHSTISLHNENLTILEEKQRNNKSIYT